MLKGLVAWWGHNPVAGNLLMIACAIAGCPRSQSQATMRRGCSSGQAS